MSRVRFDRPFVVKNLLLATLFLTAGGCTRVSWTLRTGTLYPPKPAPCELQFTSQDPLKPWDMDRYQLLGTMVAEHFKGSWDEALKKSVRDKACAVGGDIAAINIITENPWNGVQSANIMIYRRTGSEPAQLNAAAPVPTKNI